jgi:DNA-binding MarR family transcriptional regulator
VGNTPDPEPSDLMAMTLAILQAAKAVQASLSGPTEARHGLSLSEIDALANLSAAPEGALRMSQISDALVTNRPAVTRLVDGLEAKGLVERQVLAGDRRAVKAAITDAGRARFREVCPLLEEELRRKLGDVLSHEETAALRSSLAAMLSRLGEDPGRYAYPRDPALGAPAGLESEG